MQDYKLCPLFWKLDYVEICKMWNIPHFPTYPQLLQMHLVTLLKFKYRIPLFNK